MFNIGEIYQKIEEIVVDVAEDGRFSLSQVIESTADFLREKGIDSYDWAAELLVKQLDRRRRPKLDGQGCFKDVLQCWITVGDNQRVVYGHARAYDINAKRGIEDDSLKRHIRSCRLSKERDDWYLYWFSNELVTVEDIERVHPYSKDSMYSTPAWISLRDEVLRDANYTCSDCSGEATCVHHLSYEQGIICDKKFLLALCGTCHSKRHGLET
jgi:hypothetical protein